MLFLVVEVTPTQIINQVTLWCNASIACVFFVCSKREGVLWATLVIKGIGKAGKQPFAD